MWSQVDDTWLHNAVIDMLFVVVIFRIVNAECGSNMAALLSEDGKLFTAGCSKEFALGHGPMSAPVKTFKPVEKLFGEKLT